MTGADWQSSDESYEAPIGPAFKFGRDVTAVKVQLDGRRVDADARQYFH